jgi:glycerol uptake facilitator-like aquaporin
MLNAILSEIIGVFVFFSAILAYGEPIPIAIGLLAAIYAFGKISGGNYNPAVSFMLWLKGDLSFNTFITYVLAQLVGATLALIWYKNFVSKK